MSGVLLEVLDEYLEESRSIKAEETKEVLSEEVLTEDLLSEEEYKIGVQALTESFVMGQIDEASFGKGLKALGRMAKGAAGKVAGKAADSAKGAAKGAAGKVGDIAGKAADGIKDAAKGAAGKVGDIAAKGIDSYKSHIADMDDEEVKAEIANISKDFEGTSETRFKNLEKNVSQMTDEVNSAYEAAKAKKDGIENLIIKKKAKMYREFAKDQEAYKEIINSLVGSINGDSNVDYYKRELSDEERSIIDKAAELPKDEVTSDRPTSKNSRSAKAKANKSRDTKVV